MEFKLEENRLDLYVDCTPGETFSCPVCGQEVVEQVQEFSGDMSPAFSTGIQTYFPAAQIIFDRFHVMQLLNVAVDIVRREEQAYEPELKQPWYLWLTNERNLSVKQRKQLHPLSTRKLKTARAYQRAKARARGYRSTENFKCMIYLVAGQPCHLST